ncbi:3',5'-cyclic AMP phosphodiesterase CpdA [Kitasatospora sp. MAP12-15]|uniref:metallophosphoesterase family protein n=1 Tax=unclassified Kitasatospora TaxID=2633591 RepID=UPI00247499B4|nr:metallophosphoesterase [Kitasatospora sp. MAP12-44]MDH6113958.1 3',5'-cyclic AMP phosphodiesterase CpdA [Kitasatospora sp. MAP12-44]
MDQQQDGTGRLLAISDLHVAYEANRAHADALVPTSAQDWLLVAGDIGEQVADIEQVLRGLAERFATVVWVPGNHELWSPGHDPVQLRGEPRYRHLVEICRTLGVVTPEDPYPVFRGIGGPAVIVPLFLLYDYTFRPKGADTKQEALDIAYAAGVVCADEQLLHPDPYPTRDDWCRARVELTEQRLTSELDGSLPAVFVNHYPLVRTPMDVLHHPEFAQWCGTELTADWHTRFRTAAMVYGHLHIPRTTWYDGVRFEEVSVGYPREWRRWGEQPPRPRQILPGPPPPVL